jgi:hypothetical protein
MAFRDNLSNKPDPPTRNSPDNEQWLRSGVYHPHFFFPCTLLIPSPRASSSLFHPLFSVANTTMMLMSEYSSLHFPPSKLDDSPPILFVHPSRREGVYQWARILSSQRLHDVSSSEKLYKCYVRCCLSRVLRITTNHKLLQLVHASRGLTYLNTIMERQHQCYTLGGLGN